MPSRPETEIKLPVPDLTALVERLRKLRARCLGRVREQNTLFDTPASDIRLRHSLLRLRIETPASSSLLPAGPARAWLTHKRPVPRPISGSHASRYKRTLESEIAVSPRANWARLFHAIGFRPGFRYEKFRTCFRLRSLHLDLDETPVGTFLELEGAPRQIDRVARSLGFTPDHYIRATYWDLYAADARRRGKTPRHMLFRA
jgi:adenylate cyclase class 2